MPKTLVSVPPGILVSCAVAQVETVPQSIKNDYGHVITPNSLELLNVQSPVSDIDVAESARILEEQYPGYIEEAQSYLQHTMFPRQEGVIDDAMYNDILQKLGITPPKVECTLLLDQANGMKDLHQQVDISRVLISLPKETLTDFIIDAGACDAGDVLTLSGQDILRRYVEIASEDDPARRKIEEVITQTEGTSEFPYLVLDDIQVLPDILTTFRPVDMSTITNEESTSLSNIDEKIAGIMREEEGIDFDDGPLF